MASLRLGAGSSEEEEGGRRSTLAPAACFLPQEPCACGAWTSKWAPPCHLISTFAFNSLLLEYLIAYFNFQDTNPSLTKWVLFSISGN